MSADLRERVARALIVDACCEACEPDWEAWLPSADAVLDALGLEQVGFANHPAGVPPWLTLLVEDIADGEHVYRLRGDA